MKKIGVLAGVMLLGMLLFSFPAAALSLVYPLPNHFTVAPGEATFFDVNIVNAEGASIENLSVTAGNGAAFVVVVSVDAATIPASGMTKATLQIKADEQYAGSSIDGSIGISYTVGGVPKSNSNVLSVDVLAKTPQPTPTPPPAPTEPDLRLVAPGSYVTMEAGKKSTIDVTLRNISAFGASSVQLFTVASKDFKVSLEDVRPFTLGSNADKTLKLTVTPDAALPEGDYTIELQYTYMNNVKEVSTGKATIFVKIKGSPAQSGASLSLADFTVNPQSVTAGDSFVLGMSVRNTSERQASGIKVTLTGLASDGISIANATTSQTIGTMAGNSKQNVSYALTANARMKTGSYPVTLELSYIGTDGKIETESYPFYISVRAKDDSGDGRAVLEITSITRPTAVFAVGQNIVIKATVKNTGDSEAANVKVTAVPEAVILPQTANIQIINKLAPGESAELSFTFAATKAAKSQNYNIGFSVGYESGDTSGSFEQYVGVTVSNPDEEDETTTGAKSQPKIIVSNYVVDPLIVMAGKEFDLDLTYMNTHSVKGVYNIKVSASVIGSSTEKGNVFTPVGSSNTFYIDDIQPKGETTQHLRMYTVPDAQPKNYILTVRFEYEDEDGNALTATEEVGINVQQITNLEIGNVYIPTEVGLNQNQYVNFTVQNRGAVTLRNLKIKLEGEGIEAQNSELIFGNFQAGSYDYYDAQFFPIMEGMQEVRIVISYDNDLLEPVERVETYYVNVVNYGGDWGGGWNEPWMDDGMNGQEQGVVAKVIEFVKKPIVWGSAIGVVVVAGAVVTVLAVRKKRLKEMELDE